MIYMAEIFARYKGLLVMFGSLVYMFCYCAPFDLQGHPFARPKHAPLRTLQCKRRSTLYRCNSRPVDRPCGVCVNYPYSTSRLHATTAVEQNSGVRQTSLAKILAPVCVRKKERTVKRCTKPEGNGACREADPYSSPDSFLPQPSSIPPSLGLRPMSIYYLF